MFTRNPVCSAILVLIALGSAVHAQDPQPAPAEDATQAEAVEERERIEAFDGTLSFAERYMGESWNRKLFVLGDELWILGDLVRGIILFLLALGVMAAGRFLLLTLVIRRFERTAKVSATPFDDVVLAVWHHTKGWLLFFFAIYLGLRTLPLPSSAAAALDGIALILALVQAAIWASAAFNTFIEKTRERRAAEDPSAASTFGLITLVGRIAIWSSVLLLGLDNLGFDVTALIAGLGIGGIAIAFALQNILGDIFCSVAILLDKPFVAGDFIVVGDMMGTVERIGIKTTRVRSISGEQIVFSNADLLSSRIRNHKRMYERRAVFTFGVAYETPVEKLERIPGIVREIIEELDQVRFDRAHFTKLGNFSLDFEVVYFVLVPEFNAFIDRQQFINLNLMKRLAEEGVAFAYPTQELIIRPQPSAESA